MVGPLYRIRDRHGVDFDPNVVYAGVSTMFSIKLHYGGVFSSSPGRLYTGGDCNIVDELDSDEFSIHEIDSIVEELGNDGHKVIFYHYLKPDSDLDYGLEPLASDKDVINMAKYVEQGHKLIDIYVEHEKTNPDLYFTSPPKHKRIVIEELEDSKPTISRAGITPILRKLVYDKNAGECSGVGNNAGECSVADKNEGQGSSVNKVVEPYVVRLDEGQSRVPAKDLPSSAFVDEFYSSYDPYVDSHEANFDPFAGLDDVLPTNDNQPAENNLVDEVDAVIEETDCGGDQGGWFGGDDVECGGDEAGWFGGEDGGSGGDSSSDDSEDSDYIVDEENHVDDVEVDMADFQLNIDETVEFVGCEDRIEEADEEEIEEDIEVINNEYFESASDDENELDRLRRRKMKQIRKQAHATPQVYKTYFYVGQEFPNRETVKNLVKENSIETRRELRMVKNDKVRLRTVCKGVIPTLPPNEPNGPDVNGPTLKKNQISQENPVQTRNMTKERILNGGKPKKAKVDEDNKCPWVLLVSKVKDKETWEVKTYRSIHKCLQSRKNLYATSKWYSNELVQQLKTNPTIPIRAVQEQLQTKHELSVSEAKAFRAKAEAERKLRGDYATQYKMLRDYVLELQQANPNTTVKIQVQSEADHTVTTRVFRRIYVCLGALKDGFKAGQRDVLGLDGAFMKGPFPGQLLTAVSVDPNNGIYPLAYGIVETENTDSWIWFLTNLGDNLDLHSNSNFTFISDRQKGIIPALAKLFPCAEHRFCVKHIHENMKRKWKGEAYKNLLWKCAIQTTVEEFQEAMKEFREFSKPAYEWLLKISPQHWSRAHFSGRCKSDVLVNNMCEVFNGKLVGGRDKAIISTLEFAREYLMKRIVNVNNMIARADGPLTPTATRLLRHNSDEATKYTVKWGGGILYQVNGPHHDQCVVNVQTMSCNCRKWELTGIPCKHAIAVNWNMALNNQTGGLIEEWVHPCYRLETWKKVYSFKINPIRGRLFWPKCNVPTILLPPKHQTQPGRPPKARKKSRNEREMIRMSKNGKMTREYKTVTCDKCGSKGHNSRTCTGPRIPPGTNKRKTRTPGEDYSSTAPTTSQRTTPASATNKGKGVAAKDKGKGVAANDGSKKKQTQPRKKIINLG